MSPADGAFDSTSETATADFTASPITLNQICVRATDTLSNMSEPYCGSFTVKYAFEGFFQPIDNQPTVNVAQAGRTVPAKWRITDCHGVPIDDPDSFAGMWTNEVNCETAMVVGDAVEEYFPGSSGLLYPGDGRWQYNWQTPKTYANRCYVMYIEYAGGSTSPLANFKFRR